MDLTVKYLKMCNKATELQKLRGEGLWENGDYYSCTTRNGPFTSCWTDVEDEPYSIFKPYWLPKQDQLQDIAKGHVTGNWMSLHEEFSSFWKMSVHHRDLLNEFSYEKMWLAFVMKTRYDKHWNGQEWIRS